MAIMHKLAISLAAVLVISGCGKREEPKQAEAPQQVITEPGVAVTFIKGQVQAFTGGGWETAVINERLLLADSLELAAGSELELTPDSTQAVKLAGPQKGSVGELLERARQEASGAAVSKTASAVKKLQGTKQTLTTQTPTAVAGIRGTAGRPVMPPDSAQGDSSSQ
jgi:hypothetical protein